MAASIPTLWPDDIKIDVLPPVTILKYQAAKLRDITSGIIRADVTTTTGHEDFVVHRLELLAPQLDNRRYGVLSATHRADFYPIVLEADCFRPRGTGYAGAAAEAAAKAVEVATGLFATGLTWPSKSDWRPVATDQDEFLRRVGEVLRSKEVRSVIDSMLALSNQKSQPAEEDVGANGTPAGE